MSGLPSSWAVAPLGDLLTDILGGGTPDKSNTEHFLGEIPFMTVKDMHSRFIDDTLDHISQEALASSASRLVPADTLVIASRMSLGKIARPTRAVAINQDLKALFLRDGISKAYIEYAWRASADRIQAMGTGTTVKGIRLNDIRGLEVPVAPSAEQIRIADQLDTLLASIQSCHDRLEAVPALLKRFRQAVVSAGMSRALTAEWREARADAEPCESELQALCEAGRVITYGVVKLGDEVPHGAPCLRTSNVRWLRFENDGMKRIAPDLSAQYARTVLRGGEVLVNVRGTLGGVAVSTPEMKGWNVSREIAVVAIDEGRASAEYVALWIASDESQRWLGAMKKGVAYVGINIEDLRRLPVQLPARKEQDEIVRRVHSYLKLADRIAARCAAAKGQAGRLAPLALAKAFRGELVPQDPTDEPASELLARVAAARSSPETGIRPRSPRAVRPPRAPKESATMTKSRLDDDVMGQPYLAGHLRRIGTPASADELFKVAELPVADFYKQLAWEVAQDHVKDNQTTLEAGHAAG